MKSVRMMLVLAIVVGGAVAMWLWWQHAEKYPSTDDAYVGANIISIAPQVSGLVEQVKVKEGQHVKAGEVLFALNAAPFRNAKVQAEASLAVLNNGEEPARQQVAAAAAAVTSARAALNAAKAQFDRDTALLARGSASTATVQNSRAAMAQAQAGVDQAQAGLVAAQAQFNDRQNQIASAQAQLATADLNLSYATVTAPADGIIANLDLRQGAAVAAYQPLFALVETADWWVDANFKETDLPRIRPGQPATIAVDMLPGTSMTGTVATISPGSGATFALLPAQNASGNWVKVTQRFAVRIRLDTPAPDLRVGGSAMVTVDTVSGATAAGTTP